MGAWGFGILESDDAYDAIDTLGEKTGLSFEQIMEGLHDLDSPFRMLIKEKLDNEEVFNYLMEKSLDSREQFVVFSIYTSLGLREVVDTSIVKSGKPDAIEIFKKNEFDVDSWSEPEERLKNVKYIFECYDQELEFSFKSRGLFETAAEHLV